MLQDPNKGSMPKTAPPEVADIATQTAGIVADKAAQEAGAQAKEVKDKVQQAGQLASQGAAYAGMARQIGAAFSGPAGKVGPTPGIVSSTAPEPEPLGGKKPSTAAAIASSGIFGVSHLVRLTIFVEGKEIPGYKHFHLSQAATGHHHFTLVVGHDALGPAQNHEMEEARQLLGKSITVTFTYKNITEAGPERDFIGVVTQVGFTREYGNRGNIVVSGNSPTILLDGAPHIQSFGGMQVVSLFTIANTLLQEGLGSKYDYRVDPGFTNNVSYSCQYDETHYNYLARMARSYAEQFFYDGQKLHFGKLPPPQDPITLTFGKDVEEIEIQLHTRHVNRSLYGYNSSSDQRLSSGKTKVEHKSSLAREAYTASEKTFLTPSLRIAPMKAGSNQDVEVAQKSATGSQGAGVFVTKGKTSVPFLYPGCLVQMYMRQPGSAESDYLTKLMVTDIHHSVDTLGNYTGYFEAIAADTGYLPGMVIHEPVAEPQVATVTDNKDAQGRVQVRFDWQAGDKTSEWIRVMSPDAGGSEKVSTNRGFVAIPEVGDQVMVGFVHHHPDRPYVMGGLFHGKVGGGGGSGNNIKSLSSKSGNMIQLHDGEGSVFIKDHGTANMKFDGNGNATTNANSNHTVNAGSTNVINVGARKDTPPQSILKMDDEGNIMLDGKTSITFQVGGNKIVIDGSGITGTVAQGNVSFDATAGTFTIRSKATLSIATDADLKIGSSTSNISSKGATAINGADVEINKG